MSQSNSTASLPCDRRRCICGVSFGALLAGIGSRGFHEDDDGWAGSKRSTNTRPNRDHRLREMPIFAGLEFADIRKTARSQHLTPIIMMTAPPSAKPRHGGAHAGITAVMVSRSANALIIGSSSVIANPRRFIKTATYFVRTAPQQRAGTTPGPERRRNGKVDLERLRLEPEKKPGPQLSLNRRIGHVRSRMDSLGCTCGP